MWSWCCLACTEFEQPLLILFPNCCHCPSKHWQTPHIPPTHHPPLHNLCLRHQDESRRSHMAILWQMLSDAFWHIHIMLKNWFGVKHGSLCWNVSFYQPSWCLNWNMVSILSCSFYQRQLWVFQPITVCVFASIYQISLSWLIFETQLSASINSTALVTIIPVASSLRWLPFILVSSHTVCVFAS